MVREQYFKWSTLHVILYAHTIHTIHTHNTHTHTTHTTHTHIPQWHIIVQTFRNVADTLLHIFIICSIYIHGMCQIVVSDEEYDVNIYRVFYICGVFFSRLPAWIQKLIPKIFYVTEKAWNYYPFTITGNFAFIRRMNQSDHSWALSICNQFYIEREESNIMVC